MCMYLEIYNEKMKDLLAPSDKPLEVRKHPTMGVFVPGLTEVEVQTYADIQHLLDRGASNRNVASTAMNEQSSRSHAVFTLSVAQTLGDGRRRRAQLHVVDLAGSERQKKTAAAGARLKEGAAINQSLTVLGQVIFALAAQQSERSGLQHVPFRNSKLTFLLSDSLSGNSKTVMVAAVSPAASNFEETLNTLRFAQSVKKVKTTVTKNEAAEQNPEALIQRLRQEIEELKRARVADAVLAGPAPAPAPGVAERSEWAATGAAEALAARAPAAAPPPASGEAGPAPSVSATPREARCGVVVGAGGFEELSADAGEHELRDDRVQLEDIERSVTVYGTDKDRTHVQDMVSRFRVLSEHVEQANFVMSWMMEHGFMPRSEGMSKWVATVAWSVSEEAPHLQGTLRAQLRARCEAGVQVVLSYSEEEFSQVVTNFEDLSATYTEQLNEGGGQPGAGHGQPPQAEAPEEPAELAEADGLLHGSKAAQLAVAAVDLNAHRAAAEADPCDEECRAGEEHEPGRTVRGEPLQSLLPSPAALEGPRQPAPGATAAAQASLGSDSPSCESEGLRAENARLRAEVEALRRRLEAVTPPCGKGGRRAGGYPSRLEVPALGAGVRRPPSPKSRPGGPPLRGTTKSPGARAPRHTTARSTSRPQAAQVPQDWPAARSDSLKPTMDTE